MSIKDTVTHSKSHATNEITHNLIKHSKFFYFHTQNELLEPSLTNHPLIYTSCALTLAIKSFRNRNYTAC